jgi:hypothetical protein
MTEPAIPPVLVLITNDDPHPPLCASSAAGDEKLTEASLGNRHIYLSFPHDSARLRTARRTATKLATTSDRRTAPTLLTDQIRPSCDSFQRYTESELFNHLRKPLANSPKKKTRLLWSLCRTAQHGRQDGIPSGWTGI